MIKKTFAFYWRLLHRRFNNLWCALIQRQNCTEYVYCDLKHFRAGYTCIGHVHELLKYTTDTLHVFASLQYCTSSLFEPILNFIVKTIRLR